MTRDSADRFPAWLSREMWSSAGARRTVGVQGFLDVSRPESGPVFGVAKSHKRARPKHSALNPEQGRLLRAACDGARFRPSDQISAAPPVFLAFFFIAAGLTVSALAVASASSAEIVVVVVAACSHSCSNNDDAREQPRCCNCERHRLYSSELCKRFSSLRWKHSCCCCAAVAVPAAGA